MPRYARPHVTGGLFHVISRFHIHEYLMDVEGARDRYLQCLKTGLARTDARLIAYCLMSSHVHLVLQLGNRTLGSFTRSVNVGWANWLNKKKKRIGTVMADRPHSVLCDSDTYALELVRYVHNNPVRAGVVSRAAECSWSSHRAYIGLEDPPEWLDYKPVLLRLADDVKHARKIFARHVDGHRQEPRRPEFSGQVSRKMAAHIRELIKGPVEISYPVLGPDEFVLRAFGEQERANEDSAQFYHASIGVADVLRAVCEETGIERSLLLGRSRIAQATRGRKLVAWVWCERLGRPQMPVADLFGLRANAICQMLRRMRIEGVTQKEAGVIEKVVRGIRRRLIRNLEKERKQTGNHNPRATRSLLLQRLREVDERLSDDRAGETDGENL